MKAIEVKDLYFKYDKKDILKGTTFSIEEGQYVSIVGPNGSGKSTLAKLILGLLEKNQGSIKIFGKELTNDNVYQIREDVGIVFQNPDNQFIGSTVRDDIAFGLENHCVDHDKMDPLIDEFSQKVGMTKYLESEPTKLSGGQKQRVAIAGILAMMPRIIIFDESTSMLDPKGKKEIIELISKIYKENKLTILSITHDIEEVAKSDYVLVLDEGKIAMEGTSQEVLFKEKELLAHKLDIPFALKLATKLKNKKLKIKPTLDVDELVEEICQLNLKK